MTDLIARLAEKVSARRDYYERNMRHLGFVQTVEFTLEDAEACLHALKVQQAAEDLTGLLTERPNLLCPVCGMRPDMHDDWCAWGELVRVVKGEQP